MKKISYLVPCIVLFTLCTKETSITNPLKKPELSGYDKSANEYIIRNDSTIGLLYKICDCDLDSNALINTNSKDISFKQSNDTLFLECYKRDFSINDTVKTLILVSRYLRIDGSGLKGLWTNDTNYISTTTKSDESDSTLISYMFFKGSGKIFKYLDIADRAIYFYADPSKKIPTFSEAFIQDWLIDSATKFAVSLTARDDNHVELFGSTSGDTVHIRRLTSKDIIYYSNNPLYSPDTFWNSKPACPNSYYPFWFSNKFLSLNSIQ